MVQVILKWTKAVLLCKRSKSEEVLCGIPRGSCLGLLLFIGLNLSKANMYADDLHATISPNGIKGLVRMAKKSCISDWLRVNKLSAKPKKLNLWLLDTKEQ